MKKDHLHRYKLTLTVKSPLFIGNGDKLRQAEYIPDRQKWLVVSLPELLRVLAGKNLLDAFEVFISGPKNEPVSSWLRKNNVNVSAKESWVKYILDGSGFEHGNDLMAMIKTPAGNPYIPGSSLKGVLRTALIEDAMTASLAETVLNDLSSNPKDKRSGKEERVFYTLNLNKERPEDAVNDKMRAIEISDSAPFSGSPLIVCRTIDYGVNKYGSAEDKPMPLYRECVKPGSKTVMYLTVDEKLWPEFDIGYFTRVLNAHFDRNEEYNHQFSADAETDEPAINGGEIPVVLGGGTGFQVKSLVFRAAQLRSKDPRPIVHKVLRAQFWKTYKPGQGDSSPAPYKRKFAQINGRKAPFGVCAITVSED